jgi:cytochrome P450
MRGDTARFYADSMRRYGDVVRLEFMNGPVHLLTHPDHVRRVLQEKRDVYEKKSPGLEKMKLLMGEGLVTATGDLWKKQRRTIQPLFHREKIEVFAKTMMAATTEMLERLDAAAARGGKVDLTEEITRATLRIVGEALLGTDVRGDAKAVSRAVTLLSQDMTDRMKAFFSLPLGVPAPRNTRFKEQMRILFDLIGRIVRERRANDAGRTDLLTLLMRARDAETGEGMSDQQLTDEVMTMFLAGHETVSSGIAWTFHLLARNPRVRRAMNAEIDTVLGERALTLADLDRLDLTTRVVKESLRLYPPISHIPRRLTEDDIVGGYLIPKGSLVVVTPYATHRHPEFWPNAEGFDPDRFLPAAESARPRYAYFPFGGGPRVCIGNIFSIIEMQIVTTMVARRYELELVPGHPVEREMLFTLRPDKPIWVTLKRRLPTPAASTPPPSPS